MIFKQTLHNIGTLKKLVLSSFIAYYILYFGNYVLGNFESYIFDFVYLSFILTLYYFIKSLLLLFCFLLNTVFHYLNIILQL